MKEFLIEHWDTIVSIVALIASIIFCILKKPVSSSLESDIVSDLAVLIPGWINSVEIAGNGVTKKETVINLALRYVRKKLGRSLSDDESSLWSKRVSTILELDLSTPQKKEVSR